MKIRRPFTSPAGRVPEPAAGTVDAPTEVGAHGCPACPHLGDDPVSAPPPHAHAPAHADALDGPLDLLPPSFAAIDGDPLDLAGFDTAPALDTSADLDAGGLDAFGTGYDPFDLG